MVLRLLLLFAVIATMAVVGLAMLVQRNSRNVDKIDKSVADVDTSVDHLEAFVNEMEEGPTPEEEAQNAAISEAVRIVPQIKSILCEEFSDAPACQEGG